MDPTILVTGGTGKTARRLIPKLVAGGARVRPASRGGATAREAASPAAGSLQQADGAAGRTAAAGVHFDWQQTATWDAALDGVAAVYLVGPALDPDPDRALLPFLEHARRAGVRRAVLLSAMGVEQAGAEAPMRRVELAVQETMPEATLLRPNWFMQNFDEGLWHPTIAAQDAVLLPAGDARISFVDAEDIASVAASALLTGDHAGSEYALTGPEAITHAEAAALISAAAGREVRYVAIGDDEFLAALVGAGLDAGYAELLVGLFAVARAGHSAEVSDAVQRVTGRPARSFAAYVRDAGHAWEPLAAQV